MLYFPQPSQFPCRKRVVQRTVVNEDAGGGRVKLFDPGACRVEWEMELRGLALPEWEAIDDLFESVEGRLGSFGFVDPFGNLLRWSEELGAAVWAKEAGVQLTGGVADPFGGVRATRISGTGRVTQTVTVPGWFQYCVSAYVRGTVTLSAGTASAVFPATGGWRRVEWTVMPGTQAEAVTFGIAGAGAEVYGLQVEGQVGASSYKKTTTVGGFFGNAYFLDDELRMTSNSLGEFSCRVRVGANAS
ncbi:MAG: phage head spike fiber domain-containing protein [Acidobacteriota bacterium]